MLRHLPARAPCLSLGFLAAACALSGCTIEETDDSTDDAVAGQDAPADADAAPDAPTAPVETVCHDASSDSDAARDSDAATDPDLQPSAPECVVSIEPRVVDVSLPDFGLLAMMGPSPRVYQSAAQFESELGVAPPASIDFATEWAVLRSEPLFPDHGLVHYERLELCPGSHAEVVSIETFEGGCSLNGAWAPPYTLVAVAQLEVPFVLGSGSGEGHVTGFSCAERGAALGQSCTRATQCQPGAICAGLTVCTTGECVPAEQQARVENVVTTPIPDGDLAGVVSINTLTVPAGAIAADVVVEVDVQHPAPAELTLLVVAPSGRTAMVPRSNGWHRALPELSGELAEGDWGLHLIDATPGNTGQLRRWNLAVVTR